ncbi:glycosyltransferase family 2 protein [Microbulbifer sp. SAOS-129_SWC]|uniref:glycosyltransferase family 2 protein n=1 Tax=Microbulbifer sp. SAOS-129_SWC TaxID=3145235 RepID=UPI003217AE0D
MCTPINLDYRVFIAIISHGHEDLILSQLRPDKWLNESQVIKPVILSNTKSEKLNRYCAQAGILYLENEACRGFGANNNTIFRHLKESKQINSKDYFFCINPDVKTNTENLKRMAMEMGQYDFQIAAPNLLNAGGEPEDNIRKFPTLIDCILRLALKSSNTNIEKSRIQSPRNVDWASGAFLCFRADTYARLGGFDERYFMYYEDADICFRAEQQGVQTTYIPHITAIHDGARSSRKLFSNLMYHHIKSALRFIWLRGRDSSGMQR